MSLVALLGRGQSGGEKQSFNYFVVKQSTIDNTIKLIVYSAFIDLS